MGCHFLPVVGLRGVNPFAVGGPAGDLDGRTERASTSSAQFNPPTESLLDFSRTSVSNSLLDFRIKFSAAVCYKAAVFQTPLRLMISCLTPPRVRYS